MVRAVIKSWGPGISPGYYECGPRLLLLENRRKLEPKETPPTCCIYPVTQNLSDNPVRLLTNCMQQWIIFCMPQIIFHKVDLSPETFLEDIPVGTFFIGKRSSPVSNH